MASAVADAASRTLVEGSDFGDNILAALPNVIGQTIGEMVAGGMTRRREPLTVEAIKAEMIDLAPPVELAELADLPSFRMVEDGESFSTMSGGDVEQTMRFMQANPDIDPRRMRSGIFINVPGADLVVSDATRARYALSDGEYRQYLAAQAANSAFDWSALSAAGGRSSNYGRYGETSVSVYNPGLFDWGGPLYAYAYRVDEAYASRNAGYARIANANLSLGGLGDVGLGSLQVVGGFFQFVTSPITGTLDLGRAAYFGRGTLPDASDRYSSDFVFGAASAFAAPETLLTRGRAAGLVRVGAIIQELAPETVRFSQSSVSWLKVRPGGNYTYGDIVASMRRDGWVGDPIDVVRMQDGLLTSVDNTRLLAAREAGINIQANVRGFDSALPLQMIEQRRFGAAQTWGQAVTQRITGQSRAFSLSNPYGAVARPTVTGMPGG